MFIKPESISELSNWHNLSLDEVFEKLGANKDGLTKEQSEYRLLQFGPNILRESKKRPAVFRFFSQFNNVLIYVLLVAAILTSILKHWVDTGVIISVVFINALIGFIQEGKAEAALKAIDKMLHLHVRVRRDERFLTIPAEKVVPGDVVLIHSGDQIPADMRLFEVNSLKIQESILTGESHAVEKSTDKLAVDTELGDRSCMAYAGTLVINGTGMGIVVNTANDTEVGKISTLLESVKSTKTPLLKKVNVFNRWLTLAILVISFCIFAIGIFVQQYALKDMFLAAVGFAVAAIPEGLPPVLTITLAIGVTQLARHNAIIRRLPAVETLGSVTVICSDKTGTLTRNELMVQTVVTSRNKIQVSGDGYKPEGEFVINNKLVEPLYSSELMVAARAAILCNDSELTFDDNEWNVHGTPMEGALLSFGVKANFDIDFERKSNPQTDLIPFDSKHKYMATLNHGHAGNNYIYVKGAPEKVLKMCNYELVNNKSFPIQSKYWLENIESMAADAQRVLAIAYKKTRLDQAHLNYHDIDNGLVLIALFGLADPPRTEAIDALDKCYKAGINVKMITGDHATTAQAIAKQFRFKNYNIVYSGNELDALSDSELDEVAKNVNIFARTTPEHKLRLVRSLQNAGEIVGMTGDGVNDAPALKQADIGIAMGRKGTEVSKEAAEIVLADDNFASIAQAVEIGRKIYDNLLKTILMVVPTSGGEALVILTAILSFQILPITPLQILWVNMITAVTLSIALAFEPAESNIMNRSPRLPGSSIFSAYFIWRLIFVSLLLVIGTFFLFNYEYSRGMSLEAARTVAVNTIVIGEIFYLFNCRRIRMSTLNIDGIIGNKAILIAVAIVILFQMLFTYSPVMQILFSTSAIEIYSWMRIIGFGVMLFLLVEFEKYISNKHYVIHKIFSGS